MTYELGLRPNFKVRPRRLRGTEALRRMVRETQLSVNNLIYPLFVCPGDNIHEEIPSMPEQFHLSLDQLETEAAQLVELGIPAILLFGLPEHKDERASEACADDGIVQEAVRILKHTTPELLVMTDVCVCAYTDHGHCGIVGDGQILNDESLEILARMAVSHADAGADIVAPSAMMDGQVEVLRNALDGAGFSDKAIMSYAAKYASAFYGPFREAADSAPQFGNRSSYQMDPCNAREALKEIDLDIEQGADIVMVKPALAYLDVIAQARPHVQLPLAAYNVSGEYAMVKATAQLNWIDEKRVAMEILTAIKRAGADLIITYFAKEVAQWLTEEEKSV